MLGKGIKGDSQKRGLLLHTATRRKDLNSGYSLEIQDVYFTLVPDGAVKDYPTTLKVLEDKTLWERTFGRGCSQRM